MAMLFLTQLEDAHRIVWRIQQNGTGTPAQLASRLSFSQSKTERIIRELRDHGAPIAYDSNRPGYHFTESFDFIEFLRDYLEKR